MANQKIEKQITGKKLNLDKTDWTPVKFDDVVREVRETTNDPVADGIKYVIGLEHIDSENIHLNRYDSLDKKTTFNKKFQKGQVLFGRRRPYLKKAALAPFDGICSGDITVMEAKENLLPELLPFIVNNDKFFEYAVTHSAGSLSPRAKFKDLANYEFLLPPKDQQAKIAELLWAMDDVVVQENKTLDLLKMIEEIKIKDFFQTKNSKSQKQIWQARTLQELLDEGSIVSHLDGNHGSNYPRSSEFVDDGIPYISANCISDDKIDFSNAKYLSPEKALTYKKGVAIHGDILLAHNATVGPVCILNTIYEKVILSTTLTYYRVNPDVLKVKYLFYFMRSRFFQKQLEQVMNQSTRNQVPITTQRKLLFMVPSLLEQTEFVEMMEMLIKAIKAAQSKIQSSQSLQKSIINEVF